MQTQEPLHCPVHRVEVTPRNPAELIPLLAHLRAGAPVAAAVTFPCGTVLPDGRLDLCKQALGPNGCRQVVEALETNTRVISLMLGTDGIGNTGAADVARLVAHNRAIEILYLGCNNIDAKGIAPLADALADPGAAVSGLWLKRNPLEPEGARQIATLMRRNTSLRVLDLVNTWPGAGMADILDALAEGNHTVQRVYLGGNGLTATDAPRLAPLLRANLCLRALLLNVGHLGNEGAFALAAALRCNTTLEELGLASNGIGPDGAAALLDAAAVHPTLTVLDLGCAVSAVVLAAPANRLGQFGLSAAVRLLAGNHTLRTLDLRGTGVTEIGKDEIAAALADNTSLRHLRVDGPMHPAITQCLTRNRALLPEPPRSRDVALTRSVYRTA